MKKILPFLFILLSFSISYGYFSDKYYCELQGENILVSLSLDDGAEKCMSFLKDIKTSISNLDKSLENANVYIDNNESVDYRTSVKNRIKNRKERLLNLRKNILDSMNDFTKDLYERLNTIVQFYGQKELRKLKSDYNVLKSKLETNIKYGNLEEFKDNRKKLEDINYKINLLNSLINANNFEDMIPILKKLREEKIF